MLRSLTFSFGIVADLLRATATSLTWRKAAADDPAPQVAHSGYVILRYYNPNTQETNSYGRYFLADFDDATAVTGGLKEAIADLASYRHYSYDNLWLIDESTGTPMAL